MRFEPNIVWNRKNLENKTGRSAVNIRISLGGKTDYLSIYGFPSLTRLEWDQRKRRVSNKHPESTRLNAVLETELLKVRHYYIQQLERGRVPSLPDIKDWYYRKQGRVSFIEFVRHQHLVYCKTMGLSFRTVQTYRSLISHLESYRPEVKFHDLDRHYLEGFIDHLRRHGLRDVSIKKHIDRLGRMIKEAGKQGMVQVDQGWFDRLGVRPEESRRVALNLAEIRKIEQLEIAGDERLSKARDWFLFQLRTGLYYADLAVLTCDHVVETENGPVLAAERTKNNRPFFAPVYLFPKAVDTLNQRVEEVGPTGFLFADLMSEQYYNRCLKELGRKAGIAKRLSNRIARHSFADLLVASGIELAFVSKILGHSKTSTTEIYFEMNADHFASRLGKIKSLAQV
jgi:integrase/recombinase XerD